MMIYFIASMIKFFPEVQRIISAYDRDLVSPKGLRRFLGDVGGGGRVSVRSLRKFSLTRLGNQLHVGGEDKTSDPSNTMGCVTNPCTEHNGRIGLKKAGQQAWSTPKSLETGSENATL